MNREFEYMMHLLSCGALGTQPEEAGDIEFHNVIQESVKQGVMAVVYCAASKLRKTYDISMDEETWNQYEMSVISLMSKKIAINYTMKELYERFFAENIDFCVLKGISVSKLYNNPESRVSGDIDLYVHPRCIKKVFSIMEEFGFELDYKNKTHHIDAKHKVVGLVEVHEYLYDRDFVSAWLGKYGKLHESFLEEEVEGIRIKTLGYTDGSIYLFCHFLKHFIKRGAGVRQILDFILYINEYKNRIDWNYFNRFIKDCGFGKIYASLVKIGEIWFDIKINGIEVQDVEKDVLEQMIDDIYSGGTFGHEDNRGKLSFDILRLTKNGRYFMYLTKYKIPFVLRALFPTVERMKEKYPFVKKSVLLYPYAWILRLIKYRESDNTSAVAKTDDGRYTLLKNLDIV